MTAIEAQIEATQKLVASFDYAGDLRGGCEELLLGTSRLREIGQDEEAATNFEKASELAPTDEEILFGRADHLRKMGILREQKKLIDAAVVAFNRLLEVNPNNAEAWNGLGICMKVLGKNETARQYFERSNELGKMGKAKFKKRNIDSLT